LAAALSPELKASSTFRTDSFMREVRDLLTPVRRMAWRAAFRAEVVLAIEMELLGVRFGDESALGRVKLGLS
jgi:hypothetical protein